MRTPIILLSRVVICFNCGKTGHVASKCTADSKSTRKCYGCRGVCHIPRDCPTRGAQSAAQANFFTSGAVASAGNGTTQLCTVAVIDGVPTIDALLDTGSVFSMLSTAMYGRLQSAPEIQPFTEAAPKVVGVGKASAKIRGYVDVPVELDGTVVHHPLLVVERLAFSLIIGMDVIRPHDATLSFSNVPICLCARVCDVCRERRIELPAESCSAPLTACVVSRVVIEPSTAAPNQVRVQRELSDARNAAAESLASLVDDCVCAASRAAPPFTYHSASPSPVPLSTFLIPPSLSLSFTPSKRPRFADSAQSTTLRQPVLASFGRPSQLTPLAAGAVSSRVHLRL